MSFPETRESSASRRDSVRAALVDALLALVRETPFKDLSVDEIARAAGITRSAFYLYFADRRELLVAAAAQATEELYGEADRWWHGSGAPEARLRSALEGVVGLYERHASLLRVVTEVATYDEEVRAFWRRVVERFIAATADYLVRERRAGRLSRDLEPNPTAESLVWMLERSCYVYLAGGERTGRELVDSLTTAWMAALYLRADFEPRGGRKREGDRPRPLEDEGPSASGRRPTGRGGDLVAPPTKG